MLYNYLSIIPFVVIIPHHYSLSLHFSLKLEQIPGIKIAFFVSVSVRLHPKNSRYRYQHTACSVTKMATLPTPIKQSIMCLHCQAAATVCIRTYTHTYTHTHTYIHKKELICPQTHKRETPCGRVEHDRWPRRHVSPTERSQPLFRKTTRQRSSRSIWSKKFPTA